jgi:hypothetical protein
MVIFKTGDAVYTYLLYKVGVHVYIYLLYKVTGLSKENEPFQMS